MTDYTKLKLVDLKDLCVKRSLPTNGIKKDLIARLQEADSAKSSAASRLPTEASNSQRAATAAAHLPSAEEYEINWDEDDNAASATKGPAGEKVDTKAIVSPNRKEAESGAVRVTTVGTGRGKAENKEGAGANGNPATDSAAEQKTQRKKLTELYPDLPSISKGKEDKKKVSPEKKSVIAAVPAAITPTDQPQSSPQSSKAASQIQPTSKKDEVDSTEYKANLPATNIASELEKRKARLARFGEENMDSTSKEALKKLERAQRFGIAEATEAKEVKVLDSALPERRKPTGKRGHDGPVVGRGGVNKRQRYNNIGARGGNNNQPKRTGNNKPGQNGAGILNDPVEREKAEKRKQRFGN